MVRCIASFSALFLVDRYVKRFGVRLGVSIGTAIVAFSFALYAVLDSFAGYCMAAVIGGIGYSLAGMVPLALMIDCWFYSYKNFALELCATGSDFAMTIAPPLFTLLVERASLTAVFLAEELFTLAVAILAFLLLRDTPEEKGMTPLMTGKADKWPVAAHRISATRGCIVFAYSPCGSVPSLPMAQV